MNKTANMMHLFPKVEEIIANIAIGLHVPLVITEEIAHYLSTPGLVILIQKNLFIRVTSAKYPPIGRGGWVTAGFFKHLHCGFININVITCQKLILHQV